MHPVVDLDIHRPASSVALSRGSFKTAAAGGGTENDDGGGSFSDFGLGTAGFTAAVVISAPGGSFVFFLAGFFVVDPFFFFVVVDALLDCFAAWKVTNRQQRASSLRQGIHHHLPEGILRVQLVVAQRNSVHKELWNPAQQITNMLCSDVVQNTLLLLSSNPYVSEER